MENALNKSKACKRRLSLLQANPFKHKPSEIVSTETPVVVASQQVSIEASKKQCGMNGSAIVTAPAPTTTASQEQTSKLSKINLLNYVLGTCRDVLSEQLNNSELTDYSCFLNDQIYVTCSRLHYYINKLNNSKHLMMANDDQQNHSIASNSTSTSSESADAGGTNCSDSDDCALYCIQITTLTSFLAFNQQLTLNNSNTNDDTTTAELMKQLNDKIKQLIEQINVYLQSIENNLFDLILTLKETLNQLINDILTIRGELTLITQANDQAQPANDLLINKLYSNAIKIDLNLFKSFAFGIDKQFNNYLNSLIELFLNDKSKYDDANEKSQHVSNPYPPLVFN